MHDQLEPETPQGEPQATADRLQLTVKSEFVPFSKSRNAVDKPKINDLSLNWKVTLYHDGREVIRTDYSAGIGHCKSYKQGMLCVDDAEAIRHECEHGNPRSYHRKLTTPDPMDVIHALVMDAGALDFATFEEWASDFGYDPDSRKAEKIYRASLEIALTIRNAIGDTGIAELQTAFQDY